MSDTTPPNLSAVKRALLALDEMQAKLDKVERAKSEPIAVIGMACRLPGGADTPEKLWEILRDGVDAVTEVPAERWNGDQYYDPDPDAPGTMYSKAGGFLANRVDEFDAAFFGIAPREAAAMDPQQRLLLEVSWEALERAGYASDVIRPSQTGMFAGISTYDYSQLLTRHGDYADINTYSGTGNAASVAAGRVAYVLGLHGPTLSVDTACSSSLVAVHLACQSLRLGESDLALAGGVNLMLTPEPTICLARMRALSVKGRCRTFDAEADGFARGEGCAVVILKRLSDATRDGDRILATIRGSAVNHDGRSGGLTAPNGPSQEAVIRQALANARVTPREVSFIEAHGTGTPLGDPIEVNALRAVLGEGRERPFFLGSGKTNFGHTEAAAGTLGLMKVILSMQHGLLPKHLHLTKPNPYIDWDTLPAIVPSALTEWARHGARRIAGVSSFGMSGTNAHVIVEEAPAEQPAEAHGPERPLHLLALSAATESAATRLAAEFAEHVAASGEPLADICFTASSGRPHHAKRIAVTGRTREEISAGLRAATVSGGGATQRKIAFLFTGQGSQYAGMARQLYDTHPDFQRAIDRCAAIWKQKLEPSLESVIFGERGALLDQTQYTQPALFAIEFALAELWRSWGIEPHAVLGHSAGELVAAAVAGVLTPEDALALLIERARLMQALPAAGLMVAVAAAESVVAAHIERHGDAISVAAVNAPTETVISGDHAAMRAVMAALETAGVAHRALRTSHAFHSRLMEPMLPALRDAAAKLRFSAPSVPLVSNVSGDFAGAALLADPDYWTKHARGTVRFADGIRTLARSGVTHFLEIGPTATLVALGRRTLPGSGSWHTSLQKGKEDWAQMLDTLSGLYTGGFDVDWRELDRPYARRRVALPTYPFERTRHWVTLGADRSVPRTASLLGEPLRSPAFAGDVYQTALSVGAMPLLGGHRIRGAAIVPAAAYVEMACLAGADIFGGERVTVEQLEMGEALILPETDAVVVQFIADPAHHFRIVSAVANAEGKIDGWRTHAEGQLTRGEADELVRLPVSEQVLASGAAEIPAGGFYDAFARRGAEYDGAFRSVRQLWAQGSEVFGRIELPENQRSSHLLHPALLDGAFQLFGTLLVQEDGSYLPVRIERIDLHHRLPERIWCRLKRRVAGTIAADLAVCDLTITGADGSVLAEVSGLTLKRIGRAAAESTNVAESLLHRVEWEPQALGQKRALPANGRWLIAGTAGQLRNGLADRLRDAAQQCEVADVDDPRLAHIVASQPRDGVIVLFDAPGSTFERACRAALAVTHALAGSNLPGRLWLVTRGGQWIEESGSEQGIGGAGVWGLARVVALEAPELGCARVDLDPTPAHDEAARLFDELVASSAEDQIAFRGGERFVPRLVRVKPQPDSDERAVQLQIRSRGALDQLALTPVLRRKPGPHQVEIRVRATGLNFRDVLNALGMYPGDPGPLGLECSGTIVALGDAVTELAPGDEVIAFSPGSFSDHVVSDAGFVVPKSPLLTFEQAATIPIAFLTAYHALHHLAKIRAGDRVLIHAAAGGVGMAAAQLALRAGAEVFGTAGTEEKRRLLTAMGIHHVMDSRTLDFADEVMARTAGRGVDIVLNSLVGDYITRSMDVLVPNGRFIEIGKIEVWEPAKVAAFRNDISYFSFDLGDMAANEPELVQSMFKTLSDGFADGSLDPLPHTTFPIEDAVSAFRYMAQSKHVGKVVVVQKPRVDPVPVSIHSDRTYLITGGLGALGLKIARWLRDEGARHLVLTGRGGAEGAQAQKAIRELEKDGVTIVVKRADVANEDEVRGLFQDIADTMPPLRGIVHAAGRLDDALLGEQTWDRFANTMRPKVDGAWNLHRASLEHPLDFFVTFSSTAAILGSPGQANYAAANAAMDAITHVRKSTGRPALTVNWGPWADTGMASDTSMATQRRWEAQGVELISVPRGFAALGRALRGDDTQLIAIGADWGRLLSRFPAGSEPPFLSRLARRSSSPPATHALLHVVRRIQGAAPEERQALVAEYIRGQVAKVLGFGSADAVDPARPLHDLGFDSLMAIELSNSITSLVGRKFSAATLLETPTIDDLAQVVASMLTVPPTEGNVPVLQGIGGARVVESPR